MKASELIELIQAEIEKHGDMECMKPIREEGWLYPDYEPITDVDSAQKVVCHNSVGPYYLVIS